MEMSLTQHSVISVNNFLAADIDPMHIYVFATDNRRHFATSDGTI